MKKTKQVRKPFFLHCKDFLEERLPAQRRSSETITAYVDALTVFHQFTKYRGFSIDSICFLDISVDFMLDFRKWMVEERGNKPQTANHRFSLVRSYIEYCGADDVSVASLWLKLMDIPPFRAVRIPEEALTERQVSLLLRQPPRSELGQRDLTFMTLLYVTAARVSELRLLTMGQLHLTGDNPELFFKGKGNKYRKVPLPDIVRQHILYCIELFHPEGYEDSDYLFYTCIKGNTGPLSHDCISKFLNKYAAMARKEDPSFPKIHSHLFRASRATHLNDAETDLPSISRFLGHEEVTTTMIYIKPNQEKMRKVMEKTPLHCLPPEKMKNYEKLRARMCSIR